MRKEILIKHQNDAMNECGDFDGAVNEYFSDYPVRMPSGEQGSYRITEHLADMKTIGAVLANRGKNVMALNFANPVHEGGGYVVGARAQEEDICRCSGLYYAIKQVREYYADNAPAYAKGGTDNMILTTNVKIIRDDEYNILEEPMYASFITSAAVNRFASLLSHKRTNEMMEQRIRKIISLAFDKAPQVLILGAYGCGAFGNERAEVLPMFERAINELDKPSDMEIIFAIPNMNIN
ncbi:MAG: TIGR02452 family protein [Oscillospiraceae bacterium]|nr:TIGR02452 family protein [Oscillospiraceae bacterium]